MKLKKDEHIIVVQQWVNYMNQLTKVTFVTNYGIMVPLNKKGIYKGISINQVKMTLAEVQQDYIGGNRNFITGENFRSVPLIIYDDDRRLEDINEGTAEESVEGIREAGLLSEEELIEYLADNPYTEPQAISKSIRVPKKTIKNLYKLMEIKDGKMSEYNYSVWKNIHVSGDT